MVEQTLFCMKRLENKILEMNGTSPTPKQSAEIIVMGFSCFIEFANDVLDRLQTLDDRARTRTSFKWWFVDKVLPSLLVWLILGTIAFVYAIDHKLVPIAP